MSLTLWFRVETCPHILHRIYYGVSWGELLDLVPAAAFSNRTVRHKFKYHPHQLDTWHFTTFKAVRTYSSSGVARDRGRR